MLGQDRPQLIRRRGARFDEAAACPNQRAELSSGLLDRFHPTKSVTIGSGVVGEHERVPEIRLRAGRTPPRARRFECRRFDHPHRMSGTSDRPHDQPLTSFDRDRQRRRCGELTQLNEQPSQCALGVPDQPSPHHRTVVVDHAHTVVCRTPSPIHRTLLTSKSDIAAGAGPTVGSSLFGPRGGSSLAPITRPGNDEGDQLKQAITWQDIEAVPRRSRRTGQRPAPSILIQ
jgi:hypothetical protein